MILSSLTEKPTSYYVGWRRLASIAGPSCAAPTSRAAPTPWHMSTAGVKRHDLPPICGMALYMTVALPAWKSSFLYSVTHTAAPNSDETGVTKWAVRLLFFSFFLQNDITDWCTSSVHSAAVASHSTVAFCKSIEAERKKKLSQDFIHWTLC